MKSLAILILTKNEENNIVEVISNAKQCTDDVIIIDSGSTDKTIPLAKKYLAKVCYREWDGDFSAQRNFALAQTNADWVLYLDADERLMPDTVEEIKRILQSDDMSYQYECKRKSVAFGATFNHGVLKPDFVTRMFPRESVKWVHKVHEHPECNLPKKTLPGYMEHYTCADWQEWEDKLCLYTTLWANDAFKRGKRVSLASIFGHSLGGFFKMFVLRAGFLDGMIGSYLCCTHFFYTMMKYLKLHELQRKSEVK